MNQAICRKRAPDGDGVDGLAAVMHADDLGALLDGDKRAGDAARNAVHGRLVARGRPDGRLAREPHQIGLTGCNESFRGAEQREVLLDGLAEAEARIPADAVRRNAEPLEEALPFLKVGLDLRHDILVVRGGRAVHDDEAAVRRRGGFKRAGHLEAADVVEDVRAERSHLGHDLRLGGVDAHDESFLHESLDHGNDAAALLFKRDAGFVEARTRGLAAHVDDVRAFVAHAVRPGDGVLKAVVGAAVGKGVRRHVQNAHDERVEAVDLEDLGATAPDAGALVKFCHLAFIAFVFIN